MRSYDDVIQFWFVDHGMDDWFGGKPEFDAAIKEQFGETHSRVSRGEAQGWRQYLAGKLAEIVVLDQFSRQLYRGRPEAFAQDKMALVLAQTAIAAGADLAVEHIRRPFYYLPFMHAESAVIQAEGVRLYEGYGDADQLDYMRKHKACIDRFGRFPFRNKALGRTSTPEENAYMEEFADRGF